MSTNTAIYVISLATSSDRRECFERHYAAARATVPWQFYDAHTALLNDLCYTERNAIAAKGRPLYPTELACYSSHYATWRKMLTEGADQVLIIEDDVVLDWKFVRILAEENLATLGIQYLKLFNKNITPFRLLPEIFHGRNLIDCRGFAHGMQAYMLTRLGARRFLDICKIVRRPIDDEMDRSWSHGIPNLSVFPFPAFELYGTSTIGTVRYDAHSLSARYALSRNATRLVEKLRRVRQKITGFGQLDSISL